MVNLPNGNEALKFSMGRRWDANKSFLFLYLWEFLLTKLVLHSVSLGKIAAATFQKSIKHHYASQYSWKDFVDWAYNWHGLHTVAFYCVLESLGIIVWLLFRQHEWKACAVPVADSCFFLSDWGTSGLKTFTFPHRQWIFIESPFHSLIPTLVLHTAPSGIWSRLANTPYLPFLGVQSGISLVPKPHVLTLCSFPWLQSLSSNMGAHFEAVS